MSPAEHLDSRACLGLAERDLVMAIIGRLDEQKGHAFLLDAFARLARETRLEVRLLVIGDGRLRDTLERQARASRIHDRVMFLGSRTDVHRLLPIVDVVAFSSLYEGLPIALLEAMAAGRCIVITDVPSMLEAVRADQEAVVAPSADASGLADALIRVAIDPELRGRLGDAARRRFMERFTAQRMVSRYDAIYREMMARISAR